MKMSKAGKYWNIITIVVVSALVLTLLVLIQHSSNDASDNQKLIEKGRTVYASHCASCHGIDLEGQPDWKNRNERGRLPAPPHDETGHTWHHSDQLIFELTKYGMVPPNILEGYESDMPGFEHILSDKEIWAVINFIKSRWPAEILEMQSARNYGESQFIKP
ncbi:c-type cytochrome [Kaarinaea lacus]